MKLQDLQISRFNVRDQKAEDTGLTELSESIKTRKLISKIVLRPTAGGKYEIIAGSRRCRAIEALHGDGYDLKEDEYVVFEDMDDEHALLMSLDENNQRRNLSPRELNKSALMLNQMGMKNKSIARALNITDAKLKRVMEMSQTLNKMPDIVKDELNKPPDQAKISDLHWERISKEDDPTVIKDVVDYIMEKDAPARDVPGIITAIKRNHEKMDGDSDEGDGKKADIKEGAADEPAGPIEYEHKGELVLEVNDGKETLKVIGKGEDGKEIPIEHYMEYLRHPDKFKVSVKFKMIVKPVS